MPLVTLPSTRCTLTLSFPRSLSTYLGYSRLLSTSITLSLFFLPVAPNEAKARRSSLWRKGNRHLLDRADEIGAHIRNLSRQRRVSESRQELFKHDPHLQPS